MRIHPKRAPVALVIALLALFTAVVGVLAACGGSDSTGSTTTSKAASPATSTVKQSFVSDLYGYSVDSWTGTAAQTAWDGTGSPGDGDPTVDSLSGPELQRAFGFAETTSDTLKKFVAKCRKTNSKLPVSVRAGETRTHTIAESRQSSTSPLRCGFALQASTTHDGEVYVFFTYDQPGKEAEMRDWFRCARKAVSFSA